MRAKILVFCVAFSYASCTQVDPVIKDEYVATQIENRIQEHIEKTSLACEKEALDAAEALIDSIYQQNPLRLLNDSISIPPKPVRPR